MHPSRHQLNVHFSFTVIEDDFSCRTKARVSTPSRTNFRISRPQSEVDRWLQFSSFRGRVNIFSNSSYKARFIGMSQRGQQLITVVAVFAIAALLQFDLVSTLAAPRDARQEEGCHLRELDLCLASVAVFTQNTNAHPVTNAEINRQCKILNETETCLNNFTSRCMTEQQGQFVSMIADGGLDTIRELCKPHSKLRDQYLKHGDCINQQNKGQRVCLRDFQASLEKAADIEWQDRLKLGCCAFNKMNACVRDVVEPKCGSEAYEMSRVFFRASFSRLPTITCAKYEYASKICGSLLPPAGTLPKGPKSHSVLSKLFSSYTGS